MAAGFLALDILDLEENRNERTIQFRVLRDAQNPMEMGQTEFIKTFRISKEIAHYLVQSLSPTLRPQRKHGISVQSQVLTAVRFYAVGSYQRGIGHEWGLAISQTSVSRCLQKVSSAISQQLVQTWVKFPSTAAERQKARQVFEHSDNPFPGTIGAIDCTHISIIAPAEQEEMYCNHHGYHSLNVQMICDPNLVILDVNARFPGTRHDSQIWANSPSRRIMELWHERGERKTWLIGDSGYPLEPWLMTPIPNSVIDSEKRYTDAHCRARSAVERCFGVLKGTFRCLSAQRILMYEPLRAHNIINSCVVLHNMRRLSRIHEDHEYDNHSEMDNRPLCGSEESELPRTRLAEGRRVRNQIITMHFHN